MWQGWERGSHHSISNDRGLNDGSSSPGLMIFVIPAVTKIRALQKKFRHVFSCWYSLQGWFSSLLLWYIVFYLIFFNKVLFWGSKYIYILFRTIQKQLITRMRVGFTILHGKINIHIETQRIHRVDLNAARVEQLSRKRMQLGQVREQGT